MGSVIPLGYAAEEKAEVAQAREVEKGDGFEQLRGELEKLWADRKFGKAAEQCDVYLSEEGLDAEQKQAALSLQYFSLMRARDFAKASKTAQALHDEEPTTTLGKQAMGLKQRANAALAAVDEKPKPVKPVQPKKEKPAAKPKKEKAKEAAKAEKVVSKEKPEKVSGHQQSLQALEASHLNLAKAEKAFTKAESDLAAAQAAHNEAHKAEATARELAQKKEVQESEKKVAAKKPKAKPEAPNAKKVEATPQVDAFEKRAADLRQKSEELRKKAEELRQAAEE
ncbi:MAG: hypothetical protein ACSHYB_14905 [Roseibacillus sp.]